MKDRIEYVHEADIHPLVLGLLWEGLQGTNWRVATRWKDGTPHDGNTCISVPEEVIRKVTVELYDSTIMASN